ncbi:MAG: hypothetical protein GYA24_13470 [Candidatus Lokiarchaeota archaeon]|nr:hypothetical protein [Candidatus Lokiarchaeota archaeon]
MRMTELEQFLADLQKVDCAGMFANFDFDEPLAKKDLARLAVAWRHVPDVDAMLVKEIPERLNIVLYNIDSDALVELVDFLHAERPFLTAGIDVVAKPDVLARFCRLYTVRGSSGGEHLEAALSRPITMAEVVSTAAALNSGRMKDYEDEIVLDDAQDPEDKDGDETDRLTVALKSGDDFTGMDDVIAELRVKLPIETLTAQVGLGINRDDEEFEAIPDQDT